MLHIEEVGKFCNQHKISIEALGLLYFIQNIREDDVRRQLIKYIEVYSEVSDYNNLSRTIQNLVDSGFLEDYRSDEEKKNNQYTLSKLKLTDKLKGNLFVDEEDSYIKAKSLYPDIVVIKDKSGITRQSAKASAAVKDDYYRRVFHEKVLKGGNKFEFARFCVILGEMFDPDNTGSPTRDAILGWDKFLLDWDALSRDFEKQNQSQTEWN